MRKFVVVGMILCLVSGTHASDSEYQELSGAPVEVEDIGVEVRGLEGRAPDDQEHQRSYGIFDFVRDVVSRRSKSQADAAEQKQIDEKQRDDAPNAWELEKVVSPYGGKPLLPGSGQAVVQLAAAGDGILYTLVRTGGGYYEITALDASTNKLLGSFDRSKFREYPHFIMPRREQGLWISSGIGTALYNVKGKKLFSLPLEEVVHVEKNYCLCGPLLELSHSALVHVQGGAETPIKIWRIPVDDQGAAAADRAAKTLHASVYDSQDIRRSPRVLAKLCGANFAAGDFEGVVSQWDGMTGSKTAEFKHGMDDVDSLAVTDNGSTLIFAGRGLIKIWDLRQNQAVRSFTAPFHPKMPAKERTAKYSPTQVVADGERLVVLQDGRIESQGFSLNPVKYLSMVTAWDRRVNRAEPEQILMHENAHSLAALPGDRVAVGDENRKITIFKARGS